MSMAPGLSRRLARAVNHGDPTFEERWVLMQICDCAKTWDDLPPEWQATIEAWEALR